MSTKTKTIGAMFALMVVASNANASFAHTDWDRVSTLIATTGPFVLQTDVPVPALAGRFGSSVASWHDEASGADWAIVGAPGEDGFTGAAYIYSYAPGSADWKKEARLVAPDATFGSEFGFSVAIDHETVVIGAPLHIADFFFGAAYVFVRDEATGDWTQQGDEFNGGDLDYGFAVAIAGDSLAVSEPGGGNVFTYERTGTAWSSAIKLTSTSTKPDAAFGFSLAIDAQHLLVGSPRDSEVLDLEGSATLFDRGRDGWDLSQVLRPEITTESQQQFGYAVAFSPETIVIGSPFKAALAGAIHFFSYNDMIPRWVEQSVFGGTSTMPPSLFGESLALSGETLVAGAPGIDSADVFRNDAGVWSLQSVLTNDAGTFFGWSLSAAGDKIWVGTPGKMLLSDGNAYVFINDRIFADDFD
ncbi:MAG TPA: FG-GAP repeat protein [Rudaea sp.]|nr:FG-GAP repeat protein [Rudaea sp.]